MIRSDDLLTSSDARDCRFAEMKRLTRQQGKLDIAVSELSPLGEPVIHDRGEILDDFGLAGLARLPSRRIMASPAPCPVIRCFEIITARRGT